MHRGSFMSRGLIVLVAAVATGSCGEAISIFIPPPSPELEVWFVETDEIPHDWLTVRIEAKGEAREVLGRDLVRNRGARAQFRSRTLVLPAGEAVDVRFALVMPGEDTVAVWATRYVTEVNNRQLFWFLVQPDDPCPGFTCPASERIELASRAGAAPGDRLWANWFRTCIDCRGVGIS